MPPKTKDETIPNKKVLICIDNIYLAYPNTSDWTPTSKKSSFKLLRVKSKDLSEKVNDFEAVEVPISKLRKTSSRVDDTIIKFTTKSVSPTEHYFLSPLNKRQRTNYSSSIS